MAPQFCSICGNILDLSVAQTVKCDCCGEINPNTTLSETTTTTSTNFPSRLRDLRSKTQVLTSKDTENTRRIDRECPQCKAKEMSWSEAQLRGADEGTTIFYRCTSCSYRETEQN